MYVSPAVRSITEHPIEDETVTLLLTVADATASETVADAVRAAGGTVEEELPFETLAVSVAQGAVDDICAIDGLDAVETDDTLSIDADGAGEDVD